MFPYAVESFSAEESDILRRYFTNLDQPVFALVNLPEVVKGALFARYSRSPKSLRRLFLDEFVGELDISGDATVDATVGPEAGRGALREGLLRVRRRLGGAARRGPPGLRAGVQRPDQGARVGTPDGLPRAVHPLHRLQPAPVDRALPLLPRPGLLDSPLGARYVGDMDRMFDTYGELLDEAQAWLVARHPRQERGLGLRAPPGRPGQGARRPARPAARRLAVQRRHLRHRAVLRDAAGADAVPPAARGPGLRRPDAGGAAQGHPVVPPAGRPGRPGRRVVGLPGRHPRATPGGWWGSCSATWSSPPTCTWAARRGSPRWSCSTSIPTARTRSWPPSSPPARPGPSPRCWSGCAASVPRRSARSCWPTSGSGPTGATGRGGPSSAPTTASTW